MGRLLEIVAHLNLELPQMNVVTAFLNEDLGEDVYMNIPDGVSEVDSISTI